MSNEFLDKIQEQVNEGRKITTKIQELLHQQMDLDIETLKLYACKEGTSRLDYIGAMSSLCNLMERRWEFMQTYIEQAKKTAGKIMVIQKENKKDVA